MPPSLTDLLDDMTCFDQNLTAITKSITQAAGNFRCRWLRR
jgi:hypothetical protein